VGWDLQYAIASADCGLQAVKPGAEVHQFQKRKNVKGKSCMQANFDQAKLAQVRVQCDEHYAEYAPIGIHWLKVGRDLIKWLQRNTRPASQLRWVCRGSTSPFVLVTSIAVVLV
jgi:hypothetical protein